MIYSMTAFGRSQKKGDWGIATWEVRSVNHRYLEISVRLPDILRELEQDIREIIHQFIRRGKVECTLRFQPGADLAANLSLNGALLNQLIDASWQVARKIPGELASLNIIELLSWNGVVIEENLDLSKIKGNLLDAFKMAMDELKENRRREGEALAKTVQDRLRSLEKEIKKITLVLPHILECQRTKIIQRLEDAKINLDIQRLEQEMVYYAQRIDISEEIDRILVHIGEVERSLTQVKTAGRRLDFMMQELNREANTLVSKSVDPAVIYAAVEMKVLIEQMREQVQNIE